MLFEIAFQKTLKVTKNNLSAESQTNSLTNKIIKLSKMSPRI